MTNSAAKGCIVVVEDDTDLREETVLSLSMAGLLAFGAPDGAALDRFMALQPVNLVVLDVGLPTESGLEIAARLQKSNSRIGIIMLTGRGLLDDRLAGMEGGADAYLVKPADPRELIAMVQAVHRRMQLPEHSASAPTAPWQMVGGGWSIKHQSASMELTVLQKRLLECFMAVPTGQPVSREKLMLALGYNVHDDDFHRLETMVNRFRQKIREKLGQDLPLQALPKLGYVFNAAISQEVGQ
jgi:DNA-binding response OmpR family regulator